MHRRSLIAAAVSGLLPLPALAQGIPVYDNAALLKQAAVWIKQAHDMKQQYDMLTNTYNALAHATDVQGVAGALGGVSRRILPESSEVLSAISGSRSLMGGAGGIMRLARRFDVGEDTEWAQEMQRRETITANAREFAYQGMTRSQESVLNLDTFLGWLTGQPDVTAVNAAGAGIQVEAQNMGWHSQQFQQLSLMLSTADREERQRAEQLQWRSAMDLYENTRPFPADFE